MSAQNLTVDLDTDYELHTLTTITGKGEIQVQNLCVNVTMTLQEKEGWTLVFEQESSSIEKLNITMTPGIVEDIMSWIEGSIKNELLTALPTTVFPMLNEAVVEFAQGAPLGSFFFGKYFANFTFTEPPMVSES